MKKWILLLVVSGLMGARAWAGDFKGNGGSSVACPGQALQILDFFEMKAPLQLGPPDLSFSAKAQIYLKRLAPFRQPERHSISWVCKSSKLKLYF